MPWHDVSPHIRVTGAGAAWLFRDDTVVIADVHLGYELAAQRRGGYLPPIIRGAALGTRIAGMVQALGATRLVVAGDLRHSTRDIDALERAELAEFAAAVRSVLQFDLVSGNHDRGGSLAGEATTAALRVGEVDIVHQPPSVTPDRWTICGHLHPRVTLRDETGASARFPCAMVGDRTVVIPAWSDWAGGAEARRLLPHLAPGTWRILPIHDGEIVDLGMEVRSNEE